MFADHVRGRLGEGAELPRGGVGRQDQAALAAARLKVTFEFHHVPEEVEHAVDFVGVVGRVDEERELWEAVNELVFELHADAEVPDRFCELLCVHEDLVEYIVHHQPVQVVAPGEGFVEFGHCEVPHSGGGMLCCN